MAKITDEIVLIRWHGNLEGPVYHRAHFRRCRSSKTCEGKLVETSSGKRRCNEKQYKFMDADRPWFCGWAFEHKVLHELDRILGVIGVKEVGL